MSTTFPPINSAQPQRLLVAPTLFSSFGTRQIPSQGPLSSLCLSTGFFLRCAKMDYSDLQQNYAFAAAGKDIRGPDSVSNRKGSVVCPKPRRVGLVINNPVMSLRCKASHQAEVDLKAGAELLDIILKKEGFGAEQSATQLSSSPPFFCGSPPSRAANPLVQDARFGEEKLTALSTLQSPSPLGLASPSSPCKGGCVRMKFGQKPAAVRIEGFDCFNMDSQNSSIPAVA